MFIFSTTRWSSLLVTVCTNETENFYRKCWGKYWEQTKIIVELMRHTHLVEKNYNLKWKSWGTLWDQIHTPFLSVLDSFIKIIQSFRKIFEYELIPAEVLINL